MKKLKEVKEYVAPSKRDVIGFYSFVMNEEEIPLQLDAYEKEKSNEKKVLNWIIPEMGAGSGGHTTIFRMASYLEKFGIHSRMYLYRSEKWETNAEFRKFLYDNWDILDERLEFFNSVDQMTFAHGTVATSWDTAYYLKVYQNTISKFYFVQDYEPIFYARGSEFQFAENTYQFGFRGITAGDWLRDMMREKYQMKAESFHFSYDHEIYHPRKKEDGTRRVFFYARPVTPRRDFELGLLSLQLLADKYKDLEVVFAGWDVSTYAIPFKHQNLGVVTPQQLADAYTQSDMCLVISNTNLSLVPLEVMGCASAAVCSKGANSSWQVTEENSILVEYDPIDIAEKMSYYFEHPEELETIRQKGYDSVKDSNWEMEARKVYDAVMQGIEEDTVLK